MIDYKKYGPPALAALILVVALAVALRGNFAAKPAPPPPAQEETVVPAAADKPVGIVRAGTVAKPAVLPVTSGYAGSIGALYVSEGQAVKAGQPLYKLAAAAPPPGPAGQDGYETARKEYERLKALYDKGAIPRRQVENAAARMEAARQSGGATAAAAPDTTAFAPVDGIVGDLAVAPGSAVAAGQQVLTLGSGQKLAVVVPLQQNELSAVPLGAPAAVEAAGQTLAGRVASIFPAAQDDKVPLFLAHIRLAAPPDGLLQAGMQVNVRIATGR